MTGYVAASGGFGGQNVKLVSQSSSEGCQQVNEVTSVLEPSCCGEHGRLCSSVGHRQRRLNCMCTCLRTNVCVCVIRRV